ncbi:MAG: hypothetical protein IH948_02800 [Bacteroidetes bacterium]|nr:hypothetical protein [Bacteroidota bacterium]
MMRSFWTLYLLNAFMAIILFTPFSFTGVWTDVLFILLVVVYTHFETLNKVAIKLRWTKVMLGAQYFVLIFFFSTSFTLEQIHIASVPERIYPESEFELKEYFNPVKNGRCGIGTYWKTITLKRFPVFELEIERNLCSHLDCTDDKNYESNKQL